MPKAREVKIEERRRTERKEVLETFHVFLVIPHIGLRKIYLKDVSEGGLGFIAESSDKFKKHEIIECFFYLNPSLRLPLKIKVMHVSEENGESRIGCEFSETSSRAYKAFAAFLGLLDDLAAFVET